MSMLVQYGNYVFGRPTPMVGLDSAPIYYNTLNTYTESINIVGELTGCSFTGLELEKSRFVSGILTQGIAPLTISGVSGVEPTIISGCKVTDINFPDTNPIYVWPYEITLIAYDDYLLNSINILEPVNKWNISEEEGRILSIVHDVSAKGLAFNNSQSPLAVAKNFVTGQLGEPTDYLAALLTGSNGAKTDILLFSDNETVNEINGTYGRTLTYKAGKSVKELILGTGILRTKCSCSWNESDFTQISVDGNIIGGIFTGANGVNESLFTTGDAYLYALNAYNGMKDEFLNENTNVLNQYPLSYSYDTDLKSNQIQFNFLFNDDPRNKEAVVDYDLDYGFDESCFANVNINGRVVYVGMDTDTGVRLAKLEREFSGFNFYAVCNEFYKSRSIGTGDLNPTAMEETETKNSSSNEISFSYTYTDKWAPPSYFKILDYTTSITHPIPRISAVETVTGYCLFEKNGLSLGSKTLNGSAVVSGGSGQFPQALNYINFLKSGEQPKTTRSSEDYFSYLTAETIVKNDDDGTIDFSYSWNFNFEL